MTTCQPAASIASTQATPTSVCRWLLNVSGQSTTRGPCGLAVPPRCWNHCCRVRGANAGSGRCRQPGGYRGEPGQPRRPGDGVDQLRYLRGEPGRLVDQPERVGVPAAPTPQRPVANAAAT